MCYDKNGTGKPTLYLLTKAETKYEKNFRYLHAPKVLSLFAKQLPCRKPHFNRIYNEQFLQSTCCKKRAH